MEQAIENANNKANIALENNVKLTKIKDGINKLWQTDTKEYAIEDEKLSLVAEE